VLKVHQALMLQFEESWQQLTLDLHQRHWLLVTVTVEACRPFLESIAQNSICLIFESKVVIELQIHLVDLKQLADLKSKLR
jgi:hypothetical protein